MLITVTICSKASVGSRLIAGIANSNLAEGMDIRLFCLSVLFTFQPLQLAGHSFIGVLLAVCLIVYDL